MRAKWITFLQTRASRSACRSALTLGMTASRGGSDWPLLSMRTCKVMV